MSSKRMRTLVEVWQNTSDVQADIKKHMHLQPDLQLLQQNPLYVSLNAQLGELRQEKTRCKSACRGDAMLALNLSYFNPFYSGSL